MKKTPLEILKSREITPPTKRYGRFIRFLLKCMQAKADVTYKYSFDKEEMQGKQVILLADHSTKYAYKYVLHGYPFARPNVVIGWQNIFVKFLFGILVKGGIIPKKLYQADPKSIIDMLKVIKMGGSLCIFPEGIQSSSGSLHPIYPSTANMIKKAGLPVVICKSYGAYLVRPRYKKADNKGHQEYHYELAFTEEDIKELTVDQIYERLLEKFKFNDFEWNKNARNKYIAPKGDTLAGGIEKILYRCPKCGCEFKIKTVGEEIICENCNNTLVLNEYYDLLPKTNDDYIPYSSIDEWFKHQRELVTEEVKTGFSYEYECEIYDIHTEKLYLDPYYPCGEGKITITNDGIHYIGTRHNEDVDLTFDIHATPSFPFVPGKGNEVYYQGVYYNFVPKTDRLKSVKYMLLVEEAHRLVDDLWDKVSRDAYGK